MLKNAFRFLWIGQSFASLADTLYLVALITLLYDATGSAAYTAMIPFLRCFANLVSGFLAPLAMKRYSLRKLLVFAQFNQAALLLILVAVMLAYSSTVPTWIILLFVLLLSWLEAWILPAKNAIVPLLVGEDELVKANGTLASIDNGVRMAAWSLGATLLVAVGAKNMMWISFALFTLSAIAMVCIRTRETAKQTAASLERSSAWTTLREGWIVLWRVPVLKAVAVLEILEGLAGGIFIGGVMLVYVKELLHQGEEWWGFINASFLLGTIVGGLGGIALSRWVDRRLGHTIVYGSLVFSALTFSFAWIHIPIAALLLNFLMGPAFQLRDIAQRTLCQKSVDPRMLPQVFSAKGTLMYATFGISAVLMAGLTDLLGVQSALTTAALLYAGCTVFAIAKRKLFLSASHQTQ
ncbi:MFS transporter [Cohnella endophytica]|uniref:MFS transporter n=1 Tax=Cohnella endophytica TaxID=2419778 RepID=A0A494XL37_9BACL|nr:MFS transporter [Cohnella endophytica]RKP48859.1 MFS transporter [Cohnella endophytica]